MAPTTTATTMDVDHKGKSYLKKPEPFDRNWWKVDDFIHACNLFFEGSPNKDFPTDKQKIIFILSYMNEGEALHWRKNYIETTVRQNDGTYQWPTKEVFLKALRAAFLNEDEKEESIRKLDHISQGNKTAKEYVNEFWLTVSKAGLPTDNDMMIRTFRKGLNKALATRIVYSDKKPNTLLDVTTGMGATAITKKGWYSIAIEFDRIHRDNVLALGDQDKRLTGWQPTVLWFWQAYGRGYASGPAYQRGNSYQPTYQSRPRYDPNAMDVNTLTIKANAMTFKERNDLMKKGLCFKCKRFGLARDCPNHGPQNYGNSNNQNFNNRAPAQQNDNRAFVPRNNNPFRNVHDTIKKPGPWEINKMIQALTVEEWNEMFDLAERDEEEKGPKEQDFS